MKKILILSNSVAEYRIPLFNRLAEVYDLTVAYFNEIDFPERYNFKLIQLHPKRIGSLVFLKENVFRLAKGYDAVIYTSDLHYISYQLLSVFRNRKYALINWGGDVSFSYKKGYDKDKRLDFVRYYIARKVDASLFYCSYPVDKYATYGRIPKEKLYVANNTVDIPQRVVIPRNKTHFLFIGTLYKEKRIFDLLEAYKEASKVDKGLFNVVIIGEGPERKIIEEWISKEGLGEKIRLTGAIYDDAVLFDFFIQSVACISPGQAGLSVLKSLAYGIPFITSRESITGGERFNIINNYNGFLYDGTVQSLSSLLLLLSNATDLVDKLCHNAQSYYYQYATINNMAKAFQDAIEYSLSKRVIK